MKIDRLKTGLFALCAIVLLGCSQTTVDVENNSGDSIGGFVSIEGESRMNVAPERLTAAVEILSLTDGRTSAKAKLKDGYEITYSIFNVGTPAWSESGGYFVKPNKHYTVTVSGSHEIDIR